MKPKKISSINDTLEFGKYLGCYIYSIIENDPQYLKWCLSRGIVYITDQDLYDKILDSCKNPKSNELEKFSRCPDTRKKGFCIKFIDNGKTRCNKKVVKGSEFCADHLIKVRSSRGQHDFIYVFDTGVDIDETRVYKIGRTKRLSERIKALKAGNPVGELLIASSVWNSFQLERKLHTYYSRQRFERELFLLNDEDIKFLRKLLLHTRPSEQHDSLDLLLGEL